MDNTRRNTEYGIRNAGASRGVASKPPVGELLGGYLLSILGKQIGAGSTGNYTRRSRIIYYISKRNKGNSPRRNKKHRNSPVGRKIPSHSLQGTIYVGVES